MQRNETRFRQSNYRLVKSIGNRLFTFFEAKCRQLSQWLVIFSHEVSQSLHEVLLVFIFILLYYSKLIYK